MKKLIKKHQQGGWISWLGQEGIPTLKNLYYYGSYRNPVQLQEVVVTAPETFKPYVFDRRELKFPDNRGVISENIVDYSHDDSGRLYPREGAGDAARSMGGRNIYYGPNGNDTVYYKNPSDWIWYEHGLMPVGKSNNQKKAKDNFKQNLNKSKPSSEIRTNAAYQRAKKENN